MEAPMNHKTERLLTDWIDGPDYTWRERDQLAWEVTQSQREARRMLKARHKAEWREFRRDLVWMLLGMALVIFTLWVVVPAFVQQ
jgi:hypothetical protein